MHSPRDDKDQDRIDKFTHIANEMENACLPTLEQLKDEIHITLQETYSDQEDAMPDPDLNNESARDHLNKLFNAEEEHIANLVMNEKLTSTQLTDRVKLYNDILAFCKSIQNLRDTIPDYTLDHASFAYEPEQGRINAQAMIEHSKEIVKSSQLTLLNVLHNLEEQQKNPEILSPTLPDHEQIQLTTEAINHAAAIYHEPTKLPPLEQFIRNEAFFNSLDETRAHASNPKIDTTQSPAVKNLMSKILMFIGSALIVVGCLGLVPSAGGSIALIAAGAALIAAGIGKRAVDAIKQAKEILPPASENNYDSNRLFSEIKREDSITLDSNPQIKPGGTR